MEKILSILNNLCNAIIDDGEAVEEVIDMLVCSGANISDLKLIGFSDEQIEDYVYYVSAIENVPESEVLKNLK